MFGTKKNVTNEKRTFGKHIEGLPVPQNTPMDIVLSPQELKIFNAGQEFKISFEKLHSIIPTTEISVEKTTKQSTAGAIVGAAAFGVTGAIVGGRPKTVDKKVPTAYIQINYESDGFKTIVFNVQTDWEKAFKLIDYFNSIKPTSTRISVDL